jgi:hypothetical protein
MVIEVFAGFQDLLIDQSHRFAEEGRTADLEIFASKSVAQFLGAISGEFGSDGFGKCLADVLDREP